MQSVIKAQLVSHVESKKLLWAYSHTDNSNFKRLFRLIFKTFLKFYIMSIRKYY